MLLTYQKVTLNCGKKWIFLKASVLESIFFEINDGYKIPSTKIFLADLLESQHLFEILQTSLTIKNSENVVKGRCFENRLRWRAPTFFRNEGEI